MKPANRPCLIFVIDDDPSIRRSLARFLKAMGYGVETVASSEEFLHRISVVTPSCIILDVSLPGLDGLELQQRLNEQHVAVPIIFLSGRVDVPTSVRAMKAGAQDVFVKPFKQEELLTAIERALADHQQRQQSEERCRAIRQRAGTLSPREREVMGLVVQGLLNKQSGRMLGVSEKTIKAHRAQVMRKMQADSFADLVRMADCLL